MREALRSFSQPGSKTIFMKRSARKLYSLIRDQRITAIASYLNHLRTYNLSVDPLIWDIQNLNMCLQKPLDMLF